jgi:hypothetical protein
MLDNTKIENDIRTKHSVSFMHEECVKGNVIHLFTLMKFLYKGTLCL